jgi:hypothetical protein
MLVDRSRYAANTLYCQCKATEATRRRSRELVERSRRQSRVGETAVFGLECMRLREDGP